MTAATADLSQFHLLGELDFEFGQVILEDFFTAHKNGIQHALWT